MKKYYCPYCDARTTLWSIKPILSDEWVCKGCKKRCLLDVVAIADSWEGTLAFWALFPILLVVTVTLLWICPKELTKVLLALLVGVPMFSACLLVVLCLLLKPVEWIVGASIKARSAHRQRRLKEIVRVIE